MGVRGIKEWENRMVSLTELRAIKVSIVIPVYGSDLILPKLLQVTRDAMRGVSFEMAHC